jgi:hypothetical protein
MGTLYRLHGNPPLRSPAPSRRLGVVTRAALGLRAKPTLEQAAAVTLLDHQVGQAVSRSSLLKTRSRYVYRCIGQLQRPQIGVLRAEVKLASVHRGVFQQARSFSIPKLKAKRAARLLFIESSNAAPFTSPHLYPPARGAVIAPRYSGGIKPIS